jgi:hypothetical protein
MPQIASVEPGFYRVPLPQVLTDSTHGEMRAFELNTVRVRDADGAEGSATPSPSAATARRWTRGSPASSSG